jgi:3-oxoacyl-[acyl-carrier protein] reductase
MTSANQESPSSLKGQIAAVTGASGGIGRAIALELARAGADVVVHGFQHISAAEAIAVEIERIGRLATVLVADLADGGARSRLAEEAWSWRGGIDVWVNCAGADILTGGAAHWTFEQKLHRLWQVDVDATIGLSRAIGERMKARGHGVIVNMGWDQAEQGMAGDSGEMFSAVKGAVMAFTRSLAQSLAPEVRVNCLAPGWIRTAWGDRASDYWQQRAQRQALRGRWGTPEDVGHAAAFLASPTSDFITGQVVNVNGGFRYE